MSYWKSLLLLNGMTLLCVIVKNGMYVKAKFYHLCYLTYILG